MTTVIVCADGSDSATRAATVGLAILRPVDTVVVATVVEGTDPTLAYDGTGHAGPTMTSSQLDALRERELRNGQAIVDDAIKQLGVPNLRGRVVEGSAGPELCALARAEHASSMIVGSRGRGPLRRALLGSVSDFVVRNAPCPVVVASQQV
jgi:nucleotide-binding universal stress UspA family protein